MGLHGGSICPPGSGVQVGLWVLRLVYGVWGALGEPFRDDAWATGNVVSMTKLLRGGLDFGVRLA